MYILSIDTSTALAGVALVQDEKVLAESTFMADRCLSARLVPETLRVLQSAAITINDIDLFACGIGPGSFTGVRAGVATVQGFALATGRPCAGFSSLSLLAMNFSLASLPVCSLLDARKNEVYAALCDCSGSLPTTLINDCVMPIGHFLDLLCAHLTNRSFSAEKARCDTGMTSQPGLANGPALLPFPSTPPMPPTAPCWP